MTTGTTWSHLLTILQIIAAVAGAVVLTIVTIRRANREVTRKTIEEQRALIDTLLARVEEQDMRIAEIEQRARAAETRVKELERYASPEAFHRIERLLAEQGRRQEKLLAGLSSDFRAALALMTNGKAA